MRFSRPERAEKDSAKEVGIELSATIYPMNIQKIAKALQEPGPVDALKIVLPDEIYHEDYAWMVTDAWSQVFALQKQCAQLDEIFPAKTAQHEEQFKAQVLAVAKSVHDSIFANTP